MACSAIKSWMDCEIHFYQIQSLDAHAPSLSPSSVFKRQVPVGSTHPAISEVSGERPLKEAPTGVLIFPKPSGLTRICEDFWLQESKRRRTKSPISILFYFSLISSWYLHFDRPRLVLFSRIDARQRRLPCSSMTPVGNPYRGCT